MGRKIKYSKELKITIAQRYLNGEGSTYSIGEEFGIHQVLVHRWVNEYKEYGKDAFEPKLMNSSYTKKFKEMIVQEYLNGEESYAALAIKYGIPSHSILINWVKRYNSHIELKDYIPQGDVYMTKSRKVSKEERLEIVRYCMDHDLDYKTTAKVYEVSYANVYNWVKKYKESGEDSLGDKRGRHKKEEDLDETERLKRELKKVQHELEMSQLEVRLLKKAQEIEGRWSTEQANMKSNIRRSKKSVKKRKKKTKK